MMMPYITAPPRARFIDEACYILYYLLTSTMGVLMFVYYPGVGITLADIGGALLGVAGIVSIFGVVKQRYQIELGTIWFTIAGMALMVAVSLRWASAENNELVAAVVPMSLIAHLIVLFRRWNYLDTIADRERAVTKVRNAFKR